MHDINDKSEQSGYYMNFSLDVDIIKNMLSAKVLYGLNKENTLVIHTYLLMFTTHCNVNPEET